MYSKEIIELIHELKNRDSFDHVYSVAKNLESSLKDKNEGKKWKYAFFLNKGGIPLISELLDLKSEDELGEDYKDYHGLISLIIMYLERNDDCRNMLAKYNVHKRLVKIMKNTRNIKILKNVAGAILNAALTESNQQDMIELGVLERSIEILKDEKMDFESRSNCSGCLWNFALIMENKKKIIELGGLEAILIGISSTNIELIVNCCGALMNLSLLQEHEQEFRKYNFVDKLTELVINSTEQRIISNACGTLMNLLLDRQTQIKIGQNQRFNLSLLKIVKNRNYMSEEAVNYSLGCLRNIAILEENSKILSDIDALDICIEALDHPSLFCKTQCASVIWNLAQLKENQILVGKKGGIQALLNVIRDKSDTSCHIAVLGSLWHCSFIEDNRKLFLESNGVQIVSDLLTNTTDEETLEKIFGTIWGMSISPLVSTEFYNKSLPFLMKHINSQNEAIKYCCLGCLRCILDDKERTDKLVSDNEGFFEQLLHCLFFPSKKVLKTTYELIWMLSDFTNSRERMVNEGLLIALLWVFNKKIKLDKTEKNYEKEVILLIKDKSESFSLAFSQLRLDDELSSCGDVFNDFFLRFLSRGFDEIKLVKSYIFSFKKTNSYLPDEKIVQWYYFGLSPGDWKLHASLYPSSLNLKVFTLLLAQKTRSHFFLRVKPLVLEIVKYIYQNVEIQDFQ